MKIPSLGKPPRGEKRKFPSLGSLHGGGKVKIFAWEASTGGKSENCLAWEAPIGSIVEHDVFDRFFSPLTDRNKPAVWAATPREAG